MGVDVGSVSTDLVVLDENAKVISSVYLPTRGRPIEAISEGLKIINNRFKKGLEILGCGTTGSGRHLAGKIIGADIIKNEITCQFLGVQHYIGDIETIFEIGGQDSKFISVNNGSVEDFVMNKVCAAGTGSFLEEQATELGISIIDEFSQLAFSSTRPIDLGSHCTVFMETEVVKALQQGVSTADICAGLAYSIARNYLERVATNKSIGKNLAFQGGVASNRAVVAAFEEILQQPIKVMPYNRISGAIGAALAAKDHMNGQGSLFKGFFCSDNVKLTTFQCKNCSNNCEVSIIEQGNDKLYFGDICERYTSKGKSTKTQRNIPNLAKEYISNCETYFDQHGTQNLKIGIPRASTIMGFLPFWGTFFRELDCNAVLSDKTSTEILSLGLKSLPASVCLPAKLTAGHVSSLIEKKVDVVFMPSIMHLPGNDNEHSYACPYAMAMPFMINCRGSAKVLSPVLSMTDEDAFVEGFAGYLAQFNTTTAKVREAYARGMAEQKNFHERFRKRAAQLIADDDYSYIFSVIGKPYNIFDPYINLDLFERLRKLDILAIPLEILPLKTEEIDCILPWQLSAEVFKGTIATVNSRNIYPLLISNYGCAPDAFTFRQLDSFLQNQPHLIVEFDEHRGEVGLVTRLEAFIDQLESVKSKRIQVRGKGQMPKSAALVPDKEIPICMPYWSDYVHAYAGIWEKQGYQVEILPLPNQNIRLLGEKHTLGKECSPYAMIVGDLIHLHQKNPKRNLVYHFPSVTFPCLLNQYGNSIQILIQKLGIANILLSSLNGVELTNAFGIVPMQRLYEGLLAIDVLVKASCETRPYELEKGMTDAVHQQNLQRIRRGLAENDVFAAIESSLEAITRIPVDKSMPRPQVGIAGDLYTKVNETANNNLFMWLEEQGLEVWPSPSQVDLLDCGITSGFLQSLEKLNFSQMLGTGAVALKSMIAAWRVRNTVGNRIKHLKEPGYLEMIKLARPYMNNNNYELLLVNIAKIVDFVERGADGVINAICFNCMVGNASAAIIEKIRKDYHDTPIITAVYSGNENPGRQMQIDAFVCQIKENFNGKRQKRSGKKQLQAEI
jgi:predicted CoA-substrate-specific enzyme activase